MGTTPRRRSIVLAVGALAALALLAVIAARMAPVVERGALLDFIQNYEVERVRLFGLEPYVDISGGTKDLLTAALLALAALPLAFTALKLRHVKPQTSFDFAALAAGGLYLAADEALAVHETIGHNLPFLRRLPGIDHPDDAIILVYLFVALALAWQIRHLIREAPIARRLAILAAGCVIIATGLDALPSDYGTLEELLELAGAGLLVTVAFAFSAEHLRSSPNGDPPDHPSPSIAP